MNGANVLDAATQAMVASLESQEERDRLTYFLTVELQDGKGTGILGDVFLVLKANRYYMEKLPGQFNQVETLLKAEFFRVEISLFQSRFLHQDARSLESIFDSRKLVLDPIKVDRERN